MNKPLDPTTIRNQEIDAEYNKCQNCRIEYLIIPLNKPRSYNDFGLRHCPFCGILTDETGAVVP